MSRKRGGGLANMSAPLLSNEQLVIQVKAGINTAENMAALYEQNRGLIRSIARRFQGREEFEDLMQEGYLGLSAAVDHWDPAGGASFATYAVYWIRHQMQEYVRDRGGMIRLPAHFRETVREYERLRDWFLLERGREPSRGEIQAVLRLSDEKYALLMESCSMDRMGSLDAVLPSDDSGETTLGSLVPADTDIETEYEEQVTEQAVQAAVKALTADQGAVIRLRWLEEKTVKETAGEMGLIPAAVRRLERKAFRKLERELRPYLPEEMGSLAYRGAGVERFNQTWTSSTERAALWLA